MQRGKIMNNVIDEILAKIDTMPAMVKFQMYHAAQRDNERQKELNKICEFFDDKRYRIENITIIKDGMFIVELERKEPKEALYPVVVDNKDIHEYFFSFNEALLAAISYETTGRTEAGYWAAKLMGKDEK